MHAETTGCDFSPASMVKPQIRRGRPAPCAMAVHLQVRPIPVAMAATQVSHP
jgi:hypothetical protein